MPKRNSKNIGFDYDLLYSRGGKKKGSDLVGKTMNSISWFCQSSQWLLLQALCSLGASHVGPPWVCYFKDKDCLSFLFLLNKLSSQTWWRKALPNQNFKISLTGLKSGCLHSWLLLEALRRKLVSLPFAASDSDSYSSASGPFFHLQCLTQSLLPAPHSLLLWKDPYDYINQIIQASLPHLRTLNLITPAPSLLPIR